MYITNALFYEKVFCQFKTISSITLVVNKFSFVKSIAYLRSFKILLFKRKIMYLLEYYYDYVIQTMLLDPHFLLL